MVFFPIILREISRDFARTSRIIEQNLGFIPKQFTEPFKFPTWCSESFYRPIQFHENKDANVIVDKEKFQISLNVQHFAPTDIVVKTVDDNSIVVEGKHEEKKEPHGTITRHFVRKYFVPGNHDIQNVVSSISSDGILTVTAPKLAIEESKKERVIPITHETGPTKETTPKEEVNLKN